MISVSIGGEKEWKEGKRSCFSQETQTSLEKWFQAKTSKEKKESDSVFYKKDYLKYSIKRQGDLKFEHNLCCSIF